MIYLFYIIGENGQLVWSYKYPQLPREIREHLAKYGHNNFDKLLSGAIRALWTIGKEIAGIELREVDYGPFYLLMTSKKINGSNLLFIMLADSRDHQKLLLSILNEFITKNASVINELAEMRLNPGELHDEKKEELLSSELSSSLTDILMSHLGHFEAASRKDFSSVITGITTGLIVYAMALFLTYILNKAYHFTGGNYEIFFFLVGTLDFIIPALFVGLFSGTSRNSIMSGIVVGLVVISTISLLWWDVISNVAEYVFGIEEAWIVAIAILIMGLIIGAALGILASIIAYYTCELRCLSPPTESIISEISRKEQIKLGLKSVWKSLKEIIER